MVGKKPHYVPAYLNCKYQNQIHAPNAGVMACLFFATIANVDGTLSAHRHRGLIKPISNRSKVGFARIAFSQGQ